MAAGAGAAVVESALSVLVEMDSSRCALILT